MEDILQFIQRLRDITAGVCVVATGPHTYGKPVGIAVVHDVGEFEEKCSVNTR
jgi:hypothetical protein